MWCRGQQHFLTFGLGARSTVLLHLRPLQEWIVKRDGVPLERHLRQQYRCVEDLLDFLRASSQIAMSFVRLSFCPSCLVDLPRLSETISCTTNALLMFVHLCCVTHQLGRRGQAGVQRCLQRLPLQLDADEHQLLAPIPELALKILCVSGGMRCQQGGQICASWCSRFGTTQEVSPLCDAGDSAW